MNDNIIIDTEIIDSMSSNLLKSNALLDSDSKFKKTGIDFLDNGFDKISFNIAILAKRIISAQKIIQNESNIFFEIEKNEEKILNNINTNFNFDINLIDVDYEYKNLNLDIKREISIKNNNLIENSFTDSYNDVDKVNLKKSISNSSFNTTDLSYDINKTKINDISNLNTFKTTDINYNISRPNLKEMSPNELILIDNDYESVDSLYDDFDFDGDDYEN